MEIYLYKLCDGVVEHTSLGKSLISPVQLEFFWPFQQCLTLLLVEKLRCFQMIQKPWKKYTAHPTFCPPRLSFLNRGRVDKVTYYGF